MFCLNIFAGSTPDSSHIHSKDDIKKGGSNRRIFTFSYGKNKTFFAGEITVAWVLFSLSNPDAFLKEYLKEYNTDPVNLSAHEVSVFLQILFQDLKKDTKEEQSSGQSQPKNAYQHFLLSVGLMVKQCGFSYADVLAMNLRDFLIFVKNIEVILGTKSLNDTTEKEIRDFFKDLPRGTHPVIEKTP